MNYGPSASERSASLEHRASISRAGLGSPTSSGRWSGTPAKSRETHDRFSRLQSLWHDGDRVFYRTAGDESRDQRPAIIVILHTDNGADPDVDRLSHEFNLKD